MIHTELRQRLALAGIEAEPIAEQELLTTAQVAQLLGVTLQNVCHSIDDGRFFAFPRGRALLLPGFFADRTLDRSALERTSVALGGLAADAKWQFFTQPRGEFGGVNALDALRAGQVESVVRHARAFCSTP